MFKVSYGRENRLKPLAISNKHAKIRGTLKLSEEMQQKITEVILGMIGASSKKSRSAQEKGELRLAHRRLTYRGSSDAWLRKVDADRNWVENPAYEDSYPHRTKPLEQIRCLECCQGHNAIGLKLHVRTGFCNLACQACRIVTSTARWHCACGCV